MFGLKGRVLASVVVWLAAVASVAGIASVAIDTAGRQVTSGPLAAPPPSDFPATSGAGDGPTSSASPVATATRKPAGSDSSEPTPRATSSTATGTATPPPIQAVASTYTTSAGRLRVRCEGSEITLDGGYAQPAPGWSVRMQSGGPAEVQVDFEMHGEVVLVVSACVAGSPRFQQYRMPGGHQGDPPPGGRHGGGKPPNASGEIAVTQTSSAALVEAASTNDPQASDAFAISEPAPSTPVDPVSETAGPTDPNGVSGPDQAAGSAGPAAAVDAGPTAGGATPQPVLDARPAPDLPELWSGPALTLSNSVVGPLGPS